MLLLLLVTAMWSSAFGLGAGSECTGRPSAGFAIDDIVCIFAYYVARCLPAIIAFIVVCHLFGGVTLLNIFWPGPSMHSI
jgi:hypothetical protein